MSTGLMVDLENVQHIDLLFLFSTMSMFRSIFKTKTNISGEAFCEKS